jgi:hypothetical protein
VMMLFIFRTRLNKSTKKDENKFDEETDMFENKKHGGMSAWRRLHIPAQTVIDLIVGRTQENKDFFGEQNLSAMFRDLDTDSDGLISKVCVEPWPYVCLLVYKIFVICVVHA